MGYSITLHAIMQMEDIDTVGRYNISVKIYTCVDFFFLFIIKHFEL